MLFKWRVLITSLVMDKAINTPELEIYRYDFRLGFSISLIFEHRLNDSSRSSHALNEIIPPMD